ncbi:MAG: hypothetical protein AAGD25_10150 [Cyanobacteria bacterium P01_F01_bin.150]
MAKNLGESVVEVSVAGFVILSISVGAINANGLARLVTCLFGEGMECATRAIENSSRDSKNLDNPRDDVWRKRRLTDPITAPLDQAGRRDRN